MRTHSGAENKVVGKNKDIGSEGEVEVGEVGGVEVRAGEWRVQRVEAATNHMKVLCSKVPETKQKKKLLEDDS